jgi:hypothetical protein
MDESKFFEAVQSLAQGLSQWDLLIIAGSMVIIVSADYYRPAQRKMRLTYLIFLPSWILLALSIYQGTKLQGAYVAYLMAALRKDTDPQRAVIINSIVAKVNTEVLLQIRYLEVALLCLALWLVIYICWWVFSDKVCAEDAR